MEGSRKLYVLWRVDHEQHVLTLLDPEHQNLSTDEIVKLAIQIEGEEVGNSPEEIQEMISQATDPDFPEFIGYEMPMLFLADPTNIEFLP